MASLSTGQQGPTRQTLVDFFQEFAGLGKEYLLYDDGYRFWTYTYRQVAGAARGLAARLAVAGIGKGDKVVIWSENRPEWIVAFWGCVLQGVIVVPVDHQSSEEFLVRVHALVQSRAVLIGDNVAGAEVGSVPVWRLSEMEWLEGGNVPQADIYRDDVAEIVFTSGATGEPKGVLITHRNILANLAGPERIVRHYRRSFCLLSPLRFLSLIPLSHMFGQMLGDIHPAHNPRHGGVHARIQSG